MDNRIKKIVVVLFLIFLIAAPCRAENLFNTIVYKSVLLMAVNRHVLVNRLTEEVKYILLDDGTLIPIKGPAKLHFQAMYDLQKK